VKFGYLPAGLELTDASYLYTDPGPLPKVRYSFEPIDDSRTLLIEIAPSATLNQAPCCDGAPHRCRISVNGFIGWYSPQDPYTVVRNARLSILVGAGAQTEVGRGHGLALAEVRKILKAITLAPAATSIARWYRLSDAVPKS
jgi:hypothetical protein